MASLKLDDSTMNRLREFVALKHKGQMWGKVAEEAKAAINTYIDQEEVTIPK